MQARRMLSRVLKARPMPTEKDILKVGEYVLVLVPGGPRKRGQWIQEAVTEIRKDGSIVCGKGRHKKVVAPEDYRTLPKTSIAKRVVEHMYGVSDLEKEHPNGDTKADDNGRAIRGDHIESDDEDTKRKTGQTNDLKEADEVSDHENDIQSSSVDNKNCDAQPINGGIPHEHRTPEKNVGCEEKDLDDEPTSKQNEDHVPDQGTAEAQPPPIRRSERIKNIIMRYAMMSSNRDEDEQEYLKSLYARTNGMQFMLHEYPDIPQWIREKARTSEFNTNWEPHVATVAAKTVSNTANVIGSHFVYKVKVNREHDGSQKLNLKARLCAHGNRDAERESIRSDAAVVPHFGFRLVYSMSVVYGLTLAKMDIRGAFTQSGDAKREIYVRPPGEMGLPNTLFLLKSTVYGLVSASRKFQKASDKNLIEDLQLKAIIGIPQFFYKYVENQLVLLLAKYVDDIILAGLNETWLEYARLGVSRCFELSEWHVAPKSLSINSTEVMQSTNAVTVKMDEYVRDIRPILMTPLRRKQISDKASRNEIYQVGSLAGSITYMSIALYPPALMVSSLMQQSVPFLNVARIKQMNGFVRDMMKRDRKLCYLKNDVKLADARVIIFSDAGYPHTNCSELKSVAQEGCIAGIGFAERKGDVFHTLAYFSRKQRRKSDSSFAAETIAATASFGYGTMLQEIIFELTNLKLPVTLVVDNSGLQKTIATESTPRDLSTMIDVCRLRMAYNDGYLDKIVWIQGIENPADALTKPLSGATAGILNELLSFGKLTIDVNNELRRGKALREEQ